MADTCCAYSIAGITINATSGDCLFTDFEGGDISGLDGAPIRRQVDPQGQSDGGITQTAFLGPRVVTFTGVVLIRSVDLTNREDYAAAVNVVCNAARTAWEAIRNTATAMTWTETGGGAHSLTVMYGTEGGEFSTSGNMLQKKFTVSFVAENPTIA